MDTKGICDNPSRASTILDGVEAGTVLRVTGTFEKFFLPNDEVRLSKRFYRCRRLGMPDQQTRIRASPLRWPRFDRHF
jgi:hypothetical protein